jgi:phage tail sheath gpL-like
MASTGSTATAGALKLINNYGDPSAAELECTGYFGANSEMGEMVVAAIKGVLFSSLETKLFPPIVCITLVNGAASSTLAAQFGTMLSVPAPYMALAFDGSDSTALTALQNHLTAINGNDRGDNGQFGSFGFMAVQSDTSTASPIGIGAASQAICLPWLRDLAINKSNTSAQIASAYAAVCASLGGPFLPLDGVTVGGLIAPVSSADWHTTGDTGTVALGLNAGLSPLVVNAGGKVLISRSITTSRVVASVEDVAYYDMQDWQVLYYLRKNIYVIASQPRYKQAKASIQKIQALKSEILKACGTMEELEMLQYVSLLADQFTADRSPLNRHAAVYRVPVNCVPGFHNKGIELNAGVAFDIVVA